ncbi:50S ribosomal protein L30, partial [Candidatus Woesearchaeota archaeon CG_4_10_14_0_8_um_filter_47_5]
TYDELVKKRGEPYTGEVQDPKKKIAYSGKYREIDGKKYKPFFRLSPPKGGFRKGGIKTPYVRGGALGNRKEKMNDLIQKML